MTRRERMERRADRREAWSGSAATESASRFDAAHRIADGIPLGQPILVGHHSERHARRDQERIHSNMSKACEAQTRSEHHAAVASTLRDRLDTTVFSDDDDAVEKLEARIAVRLAEVERCTALNKLLRREHKAGMLPGWIVRCGLTPTETLAVSRNVEFDYRHLPMFPAYHLSNMRGRITADRKRLDEVKAQQDRGRRATANGGLLLQRSEGHDYVRLTFDDAPPRDLLDALKAAGFSWSGGSWVGLGDRLPMEDLRHHFPESAL